MAEFKWPTGTQPVHKEAVGVLYWTILFDGPFEDESGGATKLLIDALAARGYDYNIGRLNKALAGISRTPNNPGKPRYGELVHRDMNAKRTFTIRALSPTDVTAPPNPFADAEPEPEPESEPASEPFEDLIDEDLDGDEDEFIDEDNEASVGTDLVPAAPVEVSYIDKLLYVVSAIHEVIADLSEEQIEKHRRDSEHVLAEQFAIVNELLTERENLKRENAELKRHNRQLQKAYQSLQRSTRP